VTRKFLVHTLSSSIDSTQPRPRSRRIPKKQLGVSEVSNLKWDNTKVDDNTKVYAVLTIVALLIVAVTEVMIAVWALGPTPYSSTTSQPPL